MWFQAAAAAVGIWLMAAPAVIGFGRPAAVSAWIAGPIIASVATVAAWQATRGCRWANAPSGLWLLAAPLVLHHTSPAAVNTVVCGLAVLALSLPRGRIEHGFGGGWRSLWTRADAGRETPRATRPT